MNEQKFTHENEVFETMWKNFDLMLERTIGSMIMRNADESTVTLKIGIALDRKNVPADGGGFREVVQPSFKHDLSSVMQVKDKMSGTFKGNVELIFDQDGKPIVRDIDDGQMKIWDEEGRVSIDEDDGDSELRALPGGMLGLPASEVNDADFKEVADEKPAESPFDWLMQFRNQKMRVTESAGTYTVRTVEGNKVVLSSGYMKSSPFFIEADKISEYEGKELMCVTSPENAEGEEIEAIEIWCDETGDFLFGIDNPATGSDSDYHYDDPEDEVGA